MPLPTCCIPHCSERIKRSQRQYIGQPTFFPHFKRFIGPTWNQYNLKSLVCKSCYVKIRPPRIIEPAVESCQDNRSVEHQEPGGLLMEVDPEPYENIHDANAQLQWRAPPAISTQESSLGGQFERGGRISESDYTSTVRVEELSASFVNCHLNSFPEQTVASECRQSCSMSSQQSSFTVMTNTNGTESTTPSQSTSGWFLEYSQSSQSTALSVSSGTTQSSAESELDPDYVYLENVLSTSSSHSCCMVCQEASTEGCRSRIPKSAYRQVWDTKKVLLPLNNRACSKHFDCKGLFTTDALNSIVPRRTSFKVPATKFHEWFNLVHNKNASHSFLDFSIDDVPPATYTMFLGMTKSEFDELYHIVYGQIRNSKNRHSKNAVAMLFVLLHLGISQTLIGALFGTQQTVVSDAISSVAKFLDEGFVKKHLGCASLPRQEAMVEHGRSSFSKLLDIEHGSKLIIIVDGTYFYVERPSDHAAQRLLYGGDKKRPFMRIQMLVLPSGRIVDILGPYAATSNDAACLNLILAKHNDVKTFLTESESVIVADRGYRDSQKPCKDVGIDLRIPEFLKHGEKQFSLQQANNTRLITKVRWVVECCNGRLKKRFPFFAYPIPGGYDDLFVMSLARISAAFLNHFAPNIFDETEEHVDHAETVVEKNGQENLLLKEVTLKGYTRLTPQWKKASYEDLRDFPVLTFQDLKNINCGTYQVKRAFEYIKEHHDINGDMELKIHAGLPNVVRACFQSRFRAFEKHYVWVKYNPGINGKDGVVSWFCQCAVGIRTAGTCCHVMAVIRYFGYERNQPPIPKRKPKIFHIIDARKELKQLQQYVQTQKSV